MICARLPFTNQDLLPVNKLFRTIIRSERGQTLAETLVALGFLVAGLTGAVVVAVGALRLTENGENRVFAEAMAQEGVEVLRGLRDSSASGNAESVNWPYVQVTDALTGTTQPLTWQALEDLIPDNGSQDLFVDYRGRICVESDPCDAEQAKLVQDQVTDLYRHIFATTEESTAESTRFTRRVTVSKVATGTGSDRYVQVVSTVSWIERGRPNTLSYSVRADLYDWL